MEINQTNLKNLLVFTLVAFFFLSFSKISFAEKEVKILIVFEEEAENVEGNYGKVEKRRIYIERLKEVSDKSQKDVLAFLEENRAKEIEPFYIINGISTVVPESLISEIKKFPGIKHIEKDKEDIELQGRPHWNLTATKVLSARNTYGRTGKGVVIGFIDSGVEYRHEALQENWRGTQADGTFVASGNWLDLTGNSPLPTDDSGHGTAVTGVAVGKPTSEWAGGVAPDAQWIAARAFGREFATNENILKAAQWMLAPNGDPYKTPDIINNSWGMKESKKPWFQEMLNNWIRAGIFPIFASGNEKGEAKPGSIDNPASLTDAFAVGSINENLILSKNSRRGPSYFNPDVIKPEVVAPGEAIKTTSKSGGYSIWTGTSIASPHIAGITALLLEEKNDLAIPEIREALIYSATPLVDDEYPKSPNMGYGYGMGNPEKAIDWVREQNYFLNRIYGKNRTETSIEIAKKYFSNPERIYIANDLSFADGLAMGSLTHEKPGPLILVGNALDQSTRNYLQSVRPSEIILIGGDGVLSKNLEVELQSIQKNITRISGKDRYETATEIAKKLNAPETAFLVNGLQDADAISIAGVAAKLGAPVLMTQANTIPETTLNYLEEYSVKNIILIGGTRPIGASVEEKLKGTYSVGRISGKDRFETGVLINERFLKDAKTLFFANGLNTADALSISPVIGLGENSVQITHPEHLPENVRGFLQRNSHDHYFLLGGEGSLKRPLEVEIYKVINR